VATELPVGFDRWMYPFNGTPGTRATGSTFAALDEVDFDDRDAQTLLGFDTSGDYTVGLPASAYVVTSAIVRVTVAADESFTYDPTSDPFSSYLDGGADTDTGRPIELFGVATRNGFVGLDVSGSGDPTLFAETSPYSPIPAPWHETRSAYASDYDGGTARDIGNNVRDGYDPTVWAVGTTVAVGPGDLVPIDTEFSFALDLGNVNVTHYLGSGLANGALFFTLTSLHDASQAGPATYPSYYLDAGGASLGATATLTLDVSIAPLPPGDANGDYAVDGLDYLVWASHFGDDPAADPPGSPANGDLNDDGIVDGLDYLYWAENYGAGPAAVVPEPTTVGLLLMSSLLCLGSWCRPARPTAKEAYKCEQGN
jgi:hypothetical protein